MLKSHEIFHSANGKRLILIAEDEFVNREILKEILQDDYELLFAENGKEALEVIRERADMLALVILDLIMPEMNGMDVLKQAQADPATSKIPVIVITTDQEAEVESLTEGASDFIPKPYPKPDVIRARALRAIELREDRQIISSTERDELTGLYNREYFYRYAEQYDHYHKHVAMDAIVFNINHFHMINERFGRARGDSVLRHVGQTLREMVKDVNGIVCRREADIFLVYCPHGKDYAEMLERASARLSSEGEEDSPIWMRMGVYPNVDKTIEIERRFDRAKTAADTVHGSFTDKIGLYDEQLHDNELYLEQLIEDFPTAIRDHQFQVYYQPKFDIQHEKPLLASAEALVRWQHPSQGTITPNVFIPLFEENGLIQKLDLCVWRETAAQQKLWKEQFGFTVPVSVNVSRIDIYDPHLVDTLSDLLEEFGLTADELSLEITESAYVANADQVIECVKSLRNIGFTVSMDDFGTGYSSLNMISDMPIDALKLDRGFILSAFGERKNTKMLEMVIDLADYLKVPIIAEGVETEEQMTMLKEMGCKYVQGYYFSRPVPAKDFEQFIIDRRGRNEN